MVSQEHAKESAAATFGRLAVGYDDMRRRLIPCYDAFYGTALELIAEVQRPQPLRVLELGAGTGLLSAMILDRFPAASLHLMDASAEMLEQARSRLASCRTVTFAVDDMATGDLAGPWDVVASALAIHHLEDEAKQALFRRIRGALASGGLFVNAEQVRGPTQAAEKRYVRVWLRQIRELGVTEEEIARAAERMAHDRCASVEEQMAWMREAGFADVDCSFKSWRFAVLSGRG